MVTNPSDAGLPHTIKWEFTIDPHHDLEYTALIETIEGDTFELVWSTCSPRTFLWAEAEMESDGKIVRGNAGIDDIKEFNEIIGAIKNGDVRSKGIQTKD